MRQKVAFLDTVQARASNHDLQLYLKSRQIFGQAARATIENCSSHLWFQANTLLCMYEEETSMTDSKKPEIVTKVVVANL